MSKKVVFSQKPQKKLVQDTIDQWVFGDKRGTDEAFSELSQQKKQPEKLKKLTFLIPVSLHEQLKIYSATQGKPMKDFIEKCIRDILK